MPGSIAIKVLVAVIAATGCLVAVAFAAGREQPRQERQAESPRPPRPRLVGYPVTSSLSSSAAFAYVSKLNGAAFECRLDGGEWRDCAARIRYRGLATGSHAFAVRVMAVSGARSRATRFQWTRAEPRRFAIEPLGSPAQLYPGAGPVTVPVRVRNPNPAPILVTALRVSVSADPAGCPGGANLELIPSSASPVMPLRIPAAGTVDLPTARITAPALALRDLPVNQDACRGANFPLAFSGEAHG